jgi:hypothetical protein
MKKYIFFTYSIVDFGGCTLYLKSKVSFLERNGWDVSIFSYKGGKPVILGLEKYNTTIQKLQCHPLFFSQKIIKNVYKSILSIVKKEYNEIIIESHTGSIASWGEIVAKELGAKHIIYLLNEQSWLRHKSLFLFLDFKHKRKELAGITEKSLYFMFRRFKEVPDKERYILNAATINVVEDYDATLVNDIISADYTIGSIGRLDKPYVNYMIEEIIKFAQNHSKNSINLVLIGESNNGMSEKNIRNIVKNCSNINLYITGYLYPIPKNIFKKIDVFIASSGSALVSYEQEIPTIAIDGNDYMPIGILGYTTTNGLFRNTEPINSTNEILEQILIQGCCKVIPYKKLDKIDNDTEYYSHMAFISNSAQDKKYYDILRMKPRGIFLIKCIMYRLLGLDRCIKVENYLTPKIVKLLELIEQRPGHSI